MKSGHVTLQDVALLAGVSAMTVSRALRGGRDVAPETLRIIRAAVKKTGYQPDPLLSALARYRHDRKAKPDGATLLYLHPGRSSSSFLTAMGKHQVYTSYYRGVCMEAERLGYGIEPLGMADLVQKGTLRRMINARGTTGVILAPAPALPRHLREMEINFPLVALGWTWPGSVHRVAHDHYGSMRMIMKKVVEKGFKRPGLLLSDGVDASSNYMWSACFRRELKAASDYFASPSIPFEPFRRSFDIRQWLKRWKPDVVISLDWQGREIMTLNQKKRPALVSVESMTGNAISGIDQNSEEVGRQAVDFIQSLVASPRRTDIPVIRMVPGAWNIGETFPF